MMILLLGLVFLGLILNLAFYEYRVIKNEKTPPKQFDFTGQKKGLK